MAVGLVRPDITNNPIQTGGIGPTPLDPFSTGQIGDTIQPGAGFSFGQLTTFAPPAIGAGSSLNPGVGFRPPSLIQVDPSGTQFTQTNIPYSSFGVAADETAPGYVNPNAGLGSIIEPPHGVVPGNDLYGGELPPNTNVFAQPSGGIQVVQTPPPDIYGPAYNPSPDAGVTPLGETPAGGTGFDVPPQSGFNEPGSVSGFGPNFTNTGDQTPSFDQGVNTDPGSTYFAPSGGGPTSFPDPANFSPSNPFSPISDPSGVTYGPGGGIDTQAAISGNPAAGADMASGGDAGAQAGKTFFQWLQDWAKRSVVVAIGIIFLIGALYLLGTSRGRQVAVAAVDESKKALSRTRSGSGGKLIKGMTTAGRVAAVI